MTPQKGDRQKPGVGDCGRTCHVRRYAMYDATRKPIRRERARDVAIDVQVRLLTMKGVAHKSLV